MKKITLVLALFALLAGTGTAMAQGWGGQEGRSCENNQIRTFVSVPVRPVFAPQRRVVNYRLARLEQLRRLHREHRWFDDRY